MAGHSNFTGAHLSQAQIARYLAGQLSGAEQHAVERHALACPLCAEAIEGLARVPQSQESQIAALRQSLQQRTQPPQAAKLRPLPRGAWLGMAAAALALLLVASALLYWQGTGESQQKLAATEQPESAPSANYTLADSTAVAIDSAASIALAQPEAEADEQANEQAESTAPPKPLRRTERNTGSTAPTDAGEETETDKSLAFADEEPIEVKTEEAKPKESAPPAATVEAAKPSPMHSEKKEADEGRARKMAKKISVSQDWEAFNAYLKAQTRYPASAQAQGLQGTVRVQFKVNRQGKPVSLKVLQSLSPDCDREALRLLRNGPRWQATAPTLEVDIFFGPK